MSMVFYYYYYSVVTSYLKQLWTTSTQNISLKTLLLENIEGFFHMKIFEEISTSCDMQMKMGKAAFELYVVVGRIFAKDWLLVKMVRDTTYQAMRIIFARIWKTNYYRFYWNNSIRYLTLSNFQQSKNLSNTPNGFQSEFVRFVIE